MHITLLCTQCFYTAGIPVTGSILLFVCIIIEEDIILITITFLCTYHVSAVLAVVCVAMTLLLCVWLLQ